MSCFPPLWYSVKYVIGTASSVCITMTTKTSLHPPFTYDFSFTSVILEVEVNFIPSKLGVHALNNYLLGILYNPEVINICILTEKEVRNDWHKEVGNLERFQGWTNTWSWSYKMEMQRKAGIKWEGKKSKGEWQMSEIHLRKRNKLAWMNKYILQKNMKR